VGEERREKREERCFDRLSNRKREKRRWEERKPITSYILHLT
jgi:hypothetical protein